MQIAQIQYSPEEKVVARYRMQASEDADDSEGDGSDDDEPKIYEEIVDEQFTVENIGLVSMQVKSRVTPLQMLNYEFSLFKFRNGQVEESSYPRACLLRHIINSNDRKGLKYYHDLVVQFAGQNKDEDDEDNHFAEFPQWAFWLVLQRNQIEMLADMIQWAGAGLPLEQLVKTTGTELREKPKHYQGLTVYGKKRYEAVGQTHLAQTNPCNTERTGLRKAVVLLHVLRTAASRRFCTPLRTAPSSPSNGS